MSEIINLKNMTTSLKQAKIVEIISNLNLVSFYYSSNNSTDNSLLEVLPIGLVYATNSSDLQLLALKAVDGEFQMRRYNLGRTTRFSVSLRKKPAYEYEDWKDAYKAKDTYFPTEFSGGHTLAEIDWSQWVTPNSVQNTGSVAGVAEFYFLPSNPDVFFLMNDTGDFYYMNKRSVAVVENSHFTDGMLKKASYKALLDTNTVKVGDVVGINGPSSSWEKLTLTVADVNADTGLVRIVGINKNLEVYSLSLPVAYLKKKQDVSVEIDTSVPADWDMGSNVATPVAPNSAKKGWD